MLLVLPSLYEGFGFPILEAYASGLPVVCSNSSSLLELACSEEMLSNPFDEYEIASKIRLFITHEARRVIQLEKQRDKVNEFSWKRAAEETLKEYQDLCNHTSDRSRLKRG
jgi:glycosyltransferase involved in cell wall biosynthesis